MNDELIVKNQEVLSFVDSLEEQIDFFIVSLDITNTEFIIPRWESPKQTSLISQQLLSLVDISFTFSQTKKRNIPLKINLHYWAKE
ncbi:hypothetical protein ACFLXI_03450 [Chloroflexota bacterium]